MKTEDRGPVRRCGAVLSGNDPNGSGLLLAQLLQVLQGAVPAGVNLVDAGAVGFGQRVVRVPQGVIIVAPQGQIFLFRRLFLTADHRPQPVHHGGPVVLFF